MNVLEIVLPVLVMIVVGMLCRKWKILTRDGINNMKVLVTNVMLPVAIFHALATSDYNKETGILVGIMFVMLVISFSLGFAMRPLMPEQRYRKYLPFMVSVYEGGSMAYPLYTSLCGQENLSQIAVLDIAGLLFGFSIYMGMLGQTENGEKINVTVPTGNFGNILAAYFAKQMGVPIDKLICASNDNKVLYDFFKTGVYDKNRPFILTSSPSMDILISSNLERLIYLSTGCDAEETKKRMEELSKDGKYSVTDEMRARMADFVGGYADQAANAAEIKRLYDETGYMIDTHTGVASCVYHNYVKETGDTKKTVIASTASPYKFSRSVMEAIFGSEEGKGEFELIDEMEKASVVKIPQAIEEIRDAKILHNRQCKPEEMEETVKQTFSK